MAVFAVGVWGVVKLVGPSGPPKRPPSLNEAVSTGDVAGVRAALAANPGRVRPDVWTLALEGGNLDIVRALIDAGAPVKPQDWADPPLLVAVRVRNAALVALLLERGADAGVTDREGNTALRRAVGGGDVAVARVLLAHNALAADQTAGGRLWQAAFNSNEEAVVRLLVEHGLDPNEPIPGEGMPVHLAAGRGWVECVRLLLAKGVSPDQVETVNVMTPLMHAARSSRPNVTDVARLLLAAGADPTKADAKGKTALDHARDVGPGTLPNGVLVALLKAAAERKR